MWLIVSLHASGYCHIYAVCHVVIAVFSCVVTLCFLLVINIIMSHVCSYLRPSC
jgi:hypothetical protein